MFEQRSPPEPSKCHCVQCVTISQGYCHRYPGSSVSDPYRECLFTGCPFMDGVLFSVYDLRPFRTCKMLDSQGASFERHRNTLVPNQPPPKSRKRLSLMTEPASNCWTQFSKVESPPDSRGELYLFHQGRDMPDAGTTFARMDTPAGPGEDLSSKGGPFRTRAGETFLFNGGPSRRRA